MVLPRPDVLDRALPGGDEIDGVDDGAELALIEGPSIVTLTLSVS